jgi:hypothetical protein
MKNLMFLAARKSWIFSFPGLVLVLFCVSPCFAIEPATGIAAGQLVVTTIGGLTSWIGSNSSDCAAAGLGAAWGKDVDLLQNEEKNTGWFSSGIVDAEADNAAGFGAGLSLAQKSIFGAGVSETVNPTAYAYTKPLHSDDDWHAAKGWASASVNGHVKATTNATPAPQSIQALSGSDQWWKGSYADGTVLLGFLMPVHTTDPSDDEFGIQISSAQTLYAQYSATAEYDVSYNLSGSEDPFTHVFSARVSMDQDGNVIASGIPVEDLSKTTLLDDSGLIDGYNLTFKPDVLTNIGGDEYYVAVEMPVGSIDLSNPDSSIDVYASDSGSDAANAYDSMTSVPEPATFCLLALGGLAILRRRR